MRKNTLFSILILALVLSIVLNSCEKVEKAEDSEEKNTATMTDIDGNTYKTITIGTQTWMLENLKVTRYRNGDSITHVPGYEWTSTKIGAFCIYDNDSTNKNVYGCLYNWYAISDSRNIAPVGWHVPTNDELKTLLEYLGNGAGGKLKEVGTTHWNTPNTGATNETGFTAIPTGSRNSCNAVYQGKGTVVNYWSSTSYNENDAHEYYLQHDNEYFTACWAPKTYGLPIRLIKD